LEKFLNCYKLFKTTKLFKTMKKITFLAALFITASFSSCTDDPNNPGENCSLENSLKLQTGNYWIYSTVETDTSGADIPGTEGMDSTIVEGTRMVAGKQAYMLVSYSNTKPDTMYYAVEGGKAYRLLSSMANIFDDNNCECFPVKWVAFADCSRSEWKAVDTIKEGPTGKVVGADGIPQDSRTQWHYLTNGFSQGIQSVLFGNSSVNANAFQMKGFFTHSILTPENAAFISGLRDHPYKVNNTVWIADGIGIVKYHSEGFNKFKGPDPVNISNGIRKTLIRYSVK
jgi:hypothetical protein